MNSIGLFNVPLAQKDILRDLLTEYLIELSKILDEEIGTSYPYFESYFTDENRQAFFIKLEENIIGFAFVNDYCILEENEIAIAEFYIQKESRNKGFAGKAIQQIFKLSDKKWEVKTSTKNRSALSFWRKSIQKSSKTKRDENIIFSFKH